MKISFYHKKEISFSLLLKISALYKQYNRRNVTY